MTPSAAARSFWTTRPAPCFSSGTRPGRAAFAVDWDPAPASSSFEAAQDAFVFLPFPPFNRLGTRVHDRTLGLSQGSFPMPSPLSIMVVGNKRCGDSSIRHRCVAPSSGRVACLLGARPPSHPPRLERAHWHTPPPRCLLGGDVWRRGSSFLNYTYYLRGGSLPRAATLATAIRRTEKIKRCRARTYSSAWRPPQRPGSAARARRSLVRTLRRLLIRRSRLFSAARGPASFPAKICTPLDSSG